MDDAFERSPDYTDPAEDMEVELPFPLALLPVFFPWRSLGGYLNYENWLERERFLELDQAIAVIQARQREAALFSRRSLRSELSTLESGRLDWQACVRARSGHPDRRIRHY
jgi:hypothetical protein